MKVPTMSDSYPFDLHTPVAGWDEAGALADGAVVTIEGLARAYLRAHRNTLRRSTLRERRYTLEAFCAHLGPDTAVKAVKAKHVSEYLQGLEVSAGTVRNRLCTVRALFTWAELQGVVKANPTTGIKPPRQPRGAPRSLTVAELDALQSALPDARARLIVSLMVNEGLRRAEVCGLEMADLDLKTETMRIVGKGGVVADLPITQPTLGALEAYLQERGRGAGPIIRSYTTGQGMSLAALGGLVRTWLKDAGVKTAAWDGRSAHALRHTFGTNLYRHGVPVTTIADAMRHASPQVTWVYLKHHRKMAELRSVMGQPMVDEVVGGGAIRCEQPERGLGVDN